MEQNQQKQINPEHIVNSLANRITQLTVELAQKDAVIIELNKDNENLRNELKEKAK